eukprot:7615256-Pyramimonas_sp.AAC.1
MQLLLLLLNLFSSFPVFFPRIQQPTPSPVPPCPPLSLYPWLQLLGGRIFEVGMIDERRLSANAT